MSEYFRVHFPISPGNLQNSKIRHYKSDDFIAHNFSSDSQNRREHQNTVISLNEYLNVLVPNSFQKPNLRVFFINRVQLLRRALILDSLD